MKICAAIMIGPGVQPHDALETVRPLVDGIVDINPGTITDFAAARIELLDQCRFLGYDWAVMIDTDERIVADPAVLRRLRDDLVTHPDAYPDVWMAPHVSGTYAKERIFKLPARGHYEGPVHEAFILDAGARRETLSDPIAFDELPKDPDQLKAKLERDRNILLDWVDQHGDDPRWWYYLGDTEENLGFIQDAITDFWQCWRLDGWPEEAAWAAYRAACLEAGRGDHKNAIDWCCKGLQRDCSLPELPWLAGWCCYQLGRYEQAIYWESMANKLNGARRLSERVIFSHQPAHYEGPWDVMRWAYRALGREGDARQIDYLFNAAYKDRTQKEPAPE